MGHVPVVTHSSHQVGKQMGVTLVYSTSIPWTVHLRDVGDTMRMYQEPTNKFKRLIKYTAIGIATSYVFASACEEYQSWGPPTIEINMENYQSPDGTGVAHPTIDSLCFKQEIGWPIETK